MALPRDERIDEILAYCNDHGEPETCTQFAINIETLHRYQRERRWRDTKQPKILLLDIETSTMKGRFWRLGKQYVGMEQVMSDWFILGWCAKWLFSSEMQSDFVTPKEAIKEDDSRIMKSVWKLIDEADIIIGHNLKKFDLPKLNTRFILSGLKPPMPYQIIDTLQVSYKYFGFSSAKLDYLGKILLRKQKLKTDYELWIKCEAGDQDSLDYMEKYCGVDVNVLEEVYLELLPWIKSHPNLAVLMDATEQCCPNCGGFEFEEGEGYYTTPQNKYISVRCSNCGAVNRKKDSEITKPQRKVMLVPNAR
jgi:DNA polymerase elongation subunit (family B)/predicted nucleic-acid-binding Zn-ribbon protein